MGQGAPGPHLLAAWYEGEVGGAVGEDGRPQPPLGHHSYAPSISLQLYIAVLKLCTQMTLFDQCHL